MNHMIAPCAHLTPTVQYCYGLDAVWSRALDVLIQSTEFFTYAFDVINKFRELHGKF